MDTLIETGDKGCEAAIDIHSVLTDAQASRKARSVLLLFTACGMLLLAHTVYHQHAFGLLHVDGRLGFPCKDKHFWVKGILKQT